MDRARRLTPSASRASSASVTWCCRRRSGSRFPPISNQYLNLTKNSSLGVAISYYEVTKVTQVSIAQSAPAVQAIVVLMGIYLVLSLTIAAVTNLVNRRLTLKGRR